MGVYIVEITHAHKDKPLKSPKQGHTNDIEINIVKMTIGQTSEKEATHVVETHETPFFFRHMHVTEERMI